MSDKSYVTMEQRICLACNHPFDTGSVLLNKLMSPRFEHRTTVGYGLCPKHTMEGYVTLIECDPSKSVVKADRAQPSDVYRTGRLMFVNEYKAHELIHTLPEGALAAFIEIDTFEAILARAESAPEEHNTEAANERDPANG